MFQPFPPGHLPGDIPPILFLKPGIRGKDIHLLSLNPNRVPQELSPNDETALSLHLREVSPFF